MSSVKSQTPPAESGVALRRAFIEVCENSFFAYVDECGPERFLELVDRSTPAAEGKTPPPSNWLKASIGFSGSFTGAVEVLLPEELAKTLVGTMLGEEIDGTLPEHWMFDGIGEFANMICGAWLTALCNSQAFELRPPAVTRMTPGWTLRAEPNADDDRTHRLAVNDFPVRVRFRASGE